MTPRHLHKWAVLRFPVSLNTVLLKTTAKKWWCSERGSRKLEHFQVLRKTTMSFFASLWPQYISNNLLKESKCFGKTWINLAVCFSQIKVKMLMFLNILRLAYQMKASAKSSLF
jgi:hypothetical protein